MDSNEFIIKENESLLRVFKKCNVRLHPSHSLSALNKLNKFFIKNNNVILRTGKDQTLKDFLSNVNVFFGSATSLHLEVALSGVRCFYIENIENREINTNDYYGYEQAGLVIPICFSEISLDYFSDVGLLQSKNEIIAIKRFSATYNTCWFGREGELVASILDTIDSSLMLNKPLSIHYMSKDSNSNMWST